MNRKDLLVPLVAVTIGAGGYWLYDTRSRSGSEDVKSTREPLAERFWYCHAGQPWQPCEACKLATFTTCERTRAACDESSGASFGCIPTTAAWCGTSACTMTKGSCEEIGGNGACRKERP